MLKQSLKRTACFYCPSMLINQALYVGWLLAAWHIDFDRTKVKKILIKNGIHIYYT